MLRPSTTTWPKGGERQSCISVPYSRRCNHDLSIRPAKSVSGGRAEREVTWAIKTWFNVAAVGWVGREVRLCWVTFDNETQVVGREFVQRRGNRICRRSRETKHPANTEQRLSNVRRHRIEAQVRQRAAHQGIEFTRRGDGATGSYHQPALMMRTMFRE